MRQFLKWLICAQVGLVLGTSARAVVADSAAQHYGAIPERNIFGLKAPPPAPTAQAQPAALPKLILTGITTILGNKCALMKQQPTALKPGELAKQESFILTEGQREGAVEVLQINEKSGSVKVNNSGTVMTLTFDKDGVKLQTPVALPQSPNIPPPLGGIPAAAAAPGTAPYGGAPPGTFSPGMRTLPSRNLRLPATGTTPGTAGVDVPSPTGLVNSPAVTGTVPSQTTMTPEDQAILQQVQRELQREAAGRTTPNYPATYPTTPPLPPGLSSGTPANGRPILPQ